MFKILMLNYLFVIFYDILDEIEDKGLLLKLDAKLSESIRPMAGTVRSPAAPQFCGQTNAFSTFSGLAFRTASCVQAAHFSFVAFTNNVSYPEGLKFFLPICGMHNLEKMVTECIKN